MCNIYLDAISAILGQDLKKKIRPDHAQKRHPPVIIQARRLESQELCYNQAAAQMADEIVYTSACIVGQVADATVTLES